jgi:pectinesterase inhibitor-like protein
MQQRILSASRTLQGEPPQIHEKWKGLVLLAQISNSTMAASLRGFLALAFSVSLVVVSAVTVQEACQQHTRFPELCVHALSAANPTPDAGLPELAEIAVALAQESNSAMAAFLKSLASQPGGMPPECLEQCVGQFQAAVAELKRSKVALDQFGEKATGVNRWVHAAKTDGDACMRGCHKVEGGADPDIDAKIADLGKLCSVALSLTDASVPTRNV